MRPHLRHNTLRAFRIGFHQAARAKLRSAEPPRHRQNHIRHAAPFQNFQNRTAGCSRRLAVVRTAHHISFRADDERVDDMACIAETFFLLPQPFPRRLGVAHNERLRQKSRVFDGQFKLDTLFQDQHAATVYRRTP